MNNIKRHFSTRTVQNLLIRKLENNNLYEADLFTCNSIVNMIHKTRIDERCSCLTLMLIMLNKIPFRLRQGILLCPENCSYQQENRWESAKQRYILKSIYIPFPFYKKRKKFSGQFKICTRQAIIGLGSDTNIDNVLVAFFILDFAIQFWSPQHTFFSNAEMKSTSQELWLPNRHQK